jgi:hypothetical protein
VAFRSTVVATVTSSAPGAMSDAIGPRRKSRRLAVTLLVIAIVLSAGLEVWLWSLARSWAPPSVETDQETLAFMDRVSRALRAIKGGPRSTITTP